MAQSASISHSIAGRYAQAVFDLARESGDMDRMSSEIDALGVALSGSDDLREMIASPRIGRDEQGRAIAAIAAKAGFGPTLTNTLKLMAQNRRLFVLPQLVQQLQSLIADARGEVTADVVSAVALTAAQQKRLTATLAEKSGKKVKLNTRVDDTLIGGMIVKLGSQMIDSSIKSKLASLQNAMKEVG